MLRYTGGHRVGKGTYWNLFNGRRIDVAQEAVLPGDSKSVYIKSLPGIMLLLGPLLGLLYVIFLPFIAIAIMVSLVGKKILGSIWNIAAFSWRPSEAYLGGKKKGKKSDVKKTDSS